MKLILVVTLICALIGCDNSVKSSNQNLIESTVPAKDVVVDQPEPVVEDKVETVEPTVEVEIRTPKDMSPKVSRKYKRMLIRYAHFYNGLDATIPMYASQIHQESMWRDNVSSKYADGLSQFTPSTAEWMGSLYEDLRPVNSFSAEWSIKAMIIYDNRILSNITADNECDHIAMMLSGYNGGPGWLNRDKRLATKNGLSSELWWDNVELNSDRADWAFEENRGYPRKILYSHQPQYKSWQGKYVCSQ